MYLPECQKSVTMCPFRHSTDNVRTDGQTDGIGKTILHSLHAEAR